jgi:hypothetical protein
VGKTSTSAGSTSKWCRPSASAFRGTPTLNADDESLVELEFIDLGDHTELRITHTKLTTGEAEDMDIGWASALQSLEHYLRKQRPPMPTARRE